MQKTVEQWQSAASMCELLAFSFRYPALELSEAVASGEWLDAAREIAAANGLELPADFGCEDLAQGRSGEAAADADALLHELRTESTRLFVGTPDAVTSPYEGVWRAGDDGVQALLFVNPHSMAVQRFCASCGLGQPEGTNEPLDHVATELELMEYLASVSAGIVELPEGAPAPEEFPGGSPQAAYGQFADDHAGVWMPRFAAKVAAQTRLPFYRAAAALLEVFCQ